MNGVNLQYEANRGFRQFKGGQTEATTLAQAFLQSHYNIVYNPLVCLYTMVAIATAIYFFYDLNGPLEYIRDLMQTTMGDTTIYPIVKTMATVSFNLCSWLIKHKELYIKISLVSVPVLLKPSFINIIFSCILLFVTLVFQKWTVVNIGLVAYLWFLFTQMRNPAYKFLILAIAAILFMYCWVSDVKIFVNPMNANYTKYTIK